MRWSTTITMDNRCYSKTVANVIYYYCYHYYHYYYYVRMKKARGGGAEGLTPPSTRWTESEVLFYLVATESQST